MLRELVPHIFRSVALVLFGMPIILLAMILHCIWKPVDRLAEWIGKEANRGKADIARIRRKYNT